ncbi:MAG: Zn-dependent hydrolase [Anaerolineae bacterium]|nr:Zn-dependent hydrolase [Anaerolineae bacterium]
MDNDARINGDRLLADLADLARIGATPEGGVHRPALSEADLEARRWFRARAEEAGLSAQQDGIGNISVTLPHPSSEARTVMVGSHLDSVINGGRYDGALGVIAALEVLRTIREADHQPLCCHLEAISFADEEGRWGSFMGSRALAGRLTIDDFEHSRGGKEALLAEMQAAGLTVDGALASRRDPATIKAWVEPHIEQGSQLEEAGLPIGIVTGIVGIAAYWLTFKGRADHGGTTPLDRRADALRGVAEFVRQARELVLNRFPGGVTNCGIVEVSPGVFNIVPERARLALEFRHPDQQLLEAMREALLNLALHVVEIEGLGLEVEQVGMEAPATMDREIIDAINAACQVLGLRHRHLASYAGHDTQVMAGITQAGMFFVPSVGGTSHNPHELTRDDDCINAANVLLHTVLKLASEP